MRVRYQDIKILQIHMKYDIAWKGICRYQDKIYFFNSHDETEYALLQALCPCCMDGGSEDEDECSCDETYTNVWCELKEASLIDVLKMKF